MGGREEEAGKIGHKNINKAEKQGKEYRLVNQSGKPDISIVLRLNDC